MLPSTSLLLLARSASAVDFWNNFLQRTTDTVFTVVKHMQEKYEETIYYVFIGLEKAFDKVST